MRLNDDGGTDTSATVERAGVLVIVVAGGGVAATQPSPTAAVIAAVTALIVAAITWVGTNRKLKADREKLTQEIAVQRERLLQERQIGDRRDLLLRVDDTAESFKTARKAIREAYVVWESASATTDRNRGSAKSKDHAASLVDQAVEEATEQALALFDARRRLALLLREDDPASMALEEAVAALLDAALAVADGDAIEFNRHYPAASDAFERFISAIRPRVQPDAPPAELQ
jgi:hypothetical protein